MTEAVLVTGGAGFIGAHVAAELMAAGRRVVILDDFSNASSDVVAELNALGHGTAALVTGDVRDPGALDAGLGDHGVGAVVHLAGLKAVAESVAEPLRYYDVNVGGAVALLAAMRRRGVGRLVFSSSATVYGAPDRSPIAEDAALRPANPYGRTKATIEAIVADLAAAEPGFRAISLRYFNPVGAHASGRIGERPSGVPDNLFPYIAQTAAGLRDKVRVFGNDYPTPDGTGVRDYIHVVDLATGHRAALDLLADDARFAAAAPTRHVAVNLGGGRGCSVFEAIAAFAAAAGRPVPFEIVARRPGDVAACVADPSRAAELLGWRATRDLAAMCADQWAFQTGRAPAPAEISATSNRLKSIL